MITTGDIRRVDDLGRIAIPREVRRNLGIKQGEEMEVWIDEESGTIILKKHNND